MIVHELSSFLYMKNRDQTKLLVYLLLEDSDDQNQEEGLSSVSCTCTKISSILPTVREHTVVSISLKI
jgi:hypothetical protein